MSIKRPNTSGITKSGSAISDVPDAPTIGTATVSGTTASVPFTAAATGGAPTSYTATSSPGSLTGTGASSPLSVSGLTVNTAYTFTVTATNSTGTSAASSASNSATPVSPLGYESIATVSVGSGGQANIEFTSIPQTFTHLQLRLFGRETASGTVNNEWMRFNSDTGSNYAWHDLTGNGSVTGASSQSATTAMKSATWMPGTSASTNVFGGAVVDILDYTNTNKYKTVRSLTGADNNGSGTIAFTSGLWMSTAAITTVTIVVSNFAQYSHAALYGVK